MHAGEDTDGAEHRRSTILDFDASAAEMGQAAGVEVVVDGQHAVEWVTGDVDLANSEQVLELGAAAIAEPQVDELVVDLSQVTFFDVSGVGALVQLQEDADGADKRLALRGVPAQVARVLAVTKLDETFGLSGDDTGRC